MNQRRFVEQVNLTRRRISDFDFVERMIGRTAQRVVKPVFVNDLNAAKRRFEKRDASIVSLVERVPSDRR